MPAIAKSPHASLPPQPHPPNPNHPIQAFGGRSHSPKPQPSPAIARSLESHAIPRRFIGPIPENVVNSDELVEKRRRFREVRRGAVRRLRRHGDDELGAGLGEGSEGGRMRSKMTKRITVVRRGIRRTVDLGEEEDSSSDDDGKGKQKRKDVWVGESFDIGREFFSPPGSPAVDTSAEEQRDGEEQAESSTSPAKHRPAPTTRSTQESFVTARTTFESVASEPDDEQEGYRLGENATSQSSLVEPNSRVRNSQTSSTQPLLGDLDTIPTPSQREDPANLATASPSLRKRLRSAMRKPSKLSTHSAVHASADLGDGPLRARQNRSKSVQFPVDPVQQSPAVERRVEGTKGNKRPADPAEVLGREGEDAEGTSAGAVEDAMGNEDDDKEEDDKGVLPGEVLMRDRMLVRVGHHREESLPAFDEASQRRNPCDRLDPLEEYIVVWRRGRVEFYQDWRFKINERWHGVKRLCFIVPLLPNRTSLGIFNDTDMSLSLTTSAGKLHEDVEHILQSSTTRSGAIKERVQQSRQAKWLRTGRRGSHVFVLKLAERSRAVDWFWELWRELGGELPDRVEVVIPGLSSSIRLNLPVDPDMVGGRTTQKEMNSAKVVETCWNLMKDTVDVRQILEGSGERIPDLRLAWRGEGGLQWVVDERTVQGYKRGWNVLVGLAKATLVDRPPELQLRVADHQPSHQVLEDGTRLREPPAIEGYLLRHKSSSSPKEHIYVQSHDGNLYISPMSRASPPAKPGTEAATPEELFPEVKEDWMREERKRLGKGIRSASGCVDLRDINEVALAVGTPLARDGDEADPSEQAENLFVAKLAKGGDEVTFEAHSREDAEEWVERIKALMVYWKRRHRVDARQRMDAMKSLARPMEDQSNDLLPDIFDWCVIEGCRSVCAAGRLFMKKGSWEKFRAKYLVLSDGYLVTYKIKRRHAFYPRKKAYPLFGAYVYSGMLAEEELREAAAQDALATQARVYQDGLQSSDGAEDTTFCVRFLAKASYWGKGKHAQPWEFDDDDDRVESFVPPPLSKKPPKLLIFRARSKLERDRWVWAINAEMERQARAHIRHGERLREYGPVPSR